VYQTSVTLWENVLFFVKLYFFEPILGPFIFLHYFTTFCETGCSIFSLFSDNISFYLQIFHKKVQCFGTAFATANLCA